MRCGGLERDLSRGIVKSTFNLQNQQSRAYSIVCFPINRILHHEIRPSVHESLLHIGTHLSFLQRSITASGSQKKDGGFASSHSTHFTSFALANTSPCLPAPVSVPHERESWLWLLCCYSAMRSIFKNGRSGRSVAQSRSVYTGCVSFGYGGTPFPWIEHAWRTRLSGGSC